MKEKKAPQVQVKKFQFNDVRAAENRKRRIAKDKANQQRAQRKRAQRKSQQEMALLASPNFDPRFVHQATLVAITRKHFGMGGASTRLAAFMADEANVLHRAPHPLYTEYNGFKDVILRRPFPLSTGGYVPIQQAASHYCSDNAFEILGPWHACMAQWGKDVGTGEQIFCPVPFDKAVEYIDALESRAT